MKPHENEKTVEQKDLPTGYVGTSSIDNPKVIHHVYSEYNGEDYDLVGGAGAPVRDDKGNVIFRERSSGKYFVFSEGEKRLPDISGHLTLSSSGTQHVGGVRALIDPDNNKEIYTQVEKQAALDDLKTLIYHFY
ncbi:hypothetical protein RAA17_05620 [Komagataeibacter rhaeticus]|nr:hypothetical protein [Komagataeibacter rhaeticus]